VEGCARVKGPRNGGAPSGLWRARKPAMWPEEADHAEDATVSRGFDVYLEGQRARRHEKTSINEEAEKPCALRRIAEVWVDKGGGEDGRNGGEGAGKGWLMGGEQEGCC